MPRNFVSWIRAPTWAKARLSPASQRFPRAAQSSKHHPGTSLSCEPAISATSAIASSRSARHTMRAALNISPSVCARTTAATRAPPIAR